MTFDQSPSLNEYKDGLSGKKRNEEQKKKIQSLLIILAGLILAAGIYNFTQSETAASLLGKGSLTGIVVDEKNQPLEASIFVPGTDIQGQTNSDGEFTLENIPTNTESIVIGISGAGHEIPVSIQAGSLTNLGQIQFVSTLTPR
jgi:hypothetical protein